ncbi:MAG TPA: ATP-binding protein, partial [Burkholderiaceae bacterium]|nr:ATP-binding protein [Burkholderiaceae bacterium]
GTSNPERFPEFAAIRDISAYPRVIEALQRARYSEHLAQFGRLAVDAREQQGLLDHVAVLASQALQVDVAVVYLLEPGRTAFRVAAGIGLPAAEPLGARLPNRPDTPPGFVLSTGGTVIVDDYRLEQRFTVPPGYLAAGLLSALSVPLTDRGRIVGTLTVRARVPRRFGVEEGRFIESMASLLATSLQRTQTEEALSHSQRLESVGQLTGGLAHDFNNLLTVIQGNLQVLEEQPAITGNAFAQDLVGAATRASRRGAELTSKLLAFSRRQVLQPTAIDVRGLLESLAGMLRRTLDQRIRIEVDVAADCPPVLADAGQLESALLNIAINARDAMPDGGLLRFAAAPCTALPDALRAEFEPSPVSEEEPLVSIEISDSGAGMTPEVRERVFEPFFTTKEAGRGTGLGLSTVYGFVRQSGGAIAIDSAPGEGTLVTLFLPQPTGLPAACAGEEETVDAIPAGLPVLLVEDDAEVRRVIDTFLRTLGCEPTVVASGEQALVTLAGGQQFGLLLSDIALGAGMRGTELARQVQAAHPAMPVLLMSGYSAELIEADRDSPPQWELLQKPCSREELARAITRALAAGGGAGGDGAGDDGAPIDEDEDEPR